MATKKYLSLDGLIEYDSLIKEKVNAVADTKADKEHNHDGVYYTEAEIDSKLEAKANASSVPTKTSQLTNDSGYITEETITAITASEIDEICGASIVAASEVTF